MVSHLVRRKEGRKKDILRVFHLVRKKERKKEM